MESTHATPHRHHCYTLYSWFVKDQQVYILSLDDLQQMCCVCKPRFLAQLATQRPALRIDLERRWTITGRQTFRITMTGAWSFYLHP